VSHFVTNFEVAKSCSILHLRSNSDTSNIPYSLLLLISISFQLLSLLWFCYLLISSVLILFTPDLLFRLILHVLHATDNHVVPFPSCSCIMCWLNLMFIQLLPLLFSDICLCSSPLFLNLLYLNLVSSLIQPNLIILYFVLCIILYYITLLCILHVFCIPLSDSTLTVFRSLPLTTVPKL